MDAAGNWGNTSHYNISIQTGSATVQIISPKNGDVIESSNSAVNASVHLHIDQSATVMIICNHSDATAYSSPAQTVTEEATFNNIEFKQGQNILYAVANKSGIISQSSTIYVYVSSTFEYAANKTLRISYTGCTASAQGHLCSVSEGSAYIGIGTEIAGSIPGGGGYAQLNTSTNSIKIFATKPFNTAEIDALLSSNEFEDVKAPLFGFDRKTSSFLIQEELRYSDVFMSGLTHLAPGSYEIYITHSGITSDGKVNLTLSLQEN
jgi:hypothetical protein